VHYKLRKQGRRNLMSDEHALKLSEIGFELKLRKSKTTSNEENENEKECNL